MNIHEGGLSTCSDVSMGARGLIFGLSLPPPLYFEDARSGGPSVTAHMYRLF